MQDDTQASIQDSPRKYRAICFDLDGTLLPMDIDEFLAAYFKRIAQFMASKGTDPERFISALKLGTHAMTSHADDATNQEVFWREFFKAYNPKDEDEREKILVLADEFYELDFPHIADGFKGNPEAAKAIEVLREKGYPLVLTTMPLFPKRAVEHRLAWAGVDPASFMRLTSYENSKFAKPMQEYYAENLAAIGANGTDILMVGNNTLDDMTSLDLGFDGFLVTDFLIDPVDFDMDTIKHGSLADFRRWVEELPMCENPVQEVRQGQIPLEQTMQTMKKNSIKDTDANKVTEMGAEINQQIADRHIHA